jgi:hypothetical protein
MWGFSWVCELDFLLVYGLVAVVLRMGHVLVPFALLMGYSSSWYELIQRNYDYFVGLDFCFFYFLFLFFYEVWLEAVECMHYHHWDLLCTWKGGSMLNSRIVGSISWDFEITAYSMGIPWVTSDLQARRVTRLNGKQCRWEYYNFF